MSAPTGRLDRLRTLAELSAKPRAIPKPATKLERAIANKAKRLLDAKLLREWAHNVKTRDQWKDRRTGATVRSTRQLDPLRAEAHHLEPKENKATRYDVRNGICLSFSSHFLVTTFKYRIEGTAWFTTHGCRYIDGTYPVIFVRL